MAVMYELICPKCRRRFPAGDGTVGCLEAGGWYFKDYDDKKKEAIVACEKCDEVFVDVELCK